MSLLQSLKGGGRFGVPSAESRDPIGYAVAGLRRLAQSDLLDRYGLRRQTEQAVFTTARNGFRLATRAGRVFARAGQRGRPGTHPGHAPRTGVFDLTPTEDEQLLVDVVTEFAGERVRPSAAAADDACAVPEEVLAAGQELGFASLGVPVELGGVAEHRSAIAGTLVAEALAYGDMGIAVASLSAGSVATAVGLWGTDAQQQTYLPAFTEESGVPAAALALTEPRVLFDALLPQTTAVRTATGYRLDGVKSGVPRGGDAELFLVGAELDSQPVLFLVEAGTDGLTVEADPGMGVRAAGFTTLRLDGVEVTADAVLGSEDGSTYRECVRFSRLAWCGLALGTAQAVLDYVTPYVKERTAFGQPIAHRQGVAFPVADMAIELQSMRLVTYKAAARVAQGIDATREIALARRLCADKGMRIGSDGVQLLGGHGFVKEHPVERWYRDLRAIAVLEGAVMV